nr:2OG-Fe(II) oxygenase [Hydrocoleum sp. CS-953]
MQLTAHNDGCFYTIHSDANTEMTATREMTYVYYFYQEPKSFSGGELVIYETKVEGNNLSKHNDFKVIEPRNNSIIFFPSRYLHEVLPVSCPTKAFENSRFTFNGWIRREDGSIIDN